MGKPSKEQMMEWHEEAGRLRDEMQDLISQAEELLINIPTSIKGKASQKGSAAGYADKYQWDAAMEALEMELGERL